MRNSRRDSSAFNPEKFLAAEAKVKSPPAAVRRQLACHRVLALAPDFKAALVARLQSARPDLLRPGEHPRKYLEAHSAIEAVLRQALRAEGLKLSDDIFDALLHDFFRDLLRRSLRGKSGSAPEPPTA